MATDCEHDFRIHTLLYPQFAVGTVPLNQPEAVLVVCRKCALVKRSTIQYEAV